MASVVLGAVGASVGGAMIPVVGAALFGSLGASLGNMIDSKLGLTTTVTGPRLTNLSVQDSRYGIGIPIIYGNARVAGNVIWSSNLIETQHTSTAGGKGGGSSGVTQKTFSYSVNCAIGICAGPLAGINTIWADNTVIYQNGVWNSGLFDSVSIHLGSDDQQPDSFMQSILGAANVPSYKALAYVVFDNLQLADFGNRLPNLTFEIATATETNNPVWLGSTSAAFVQRGQSVQNGSMVPIVSQSNGSTVQKVLVGGYNIPSSRTAQFVVQEFDVTGETPASLWSVSSAPFATTSEPVDSSWALAPDGRFIALYGQSSASPSHNFVIFDTESKTFGTIYGVALPSSSIYKQIAWIDATHFVIDDTLGGVRGLRVFARAGMTVIDLGFTGLWGAGSASSTSPFYGAQFTPYADGLIAYNLVTSGSIMRARAIAWRNNALSLGAVYTIASNLALSGGSGMHARLLQTSSTEWTLLYGTVMFYALMSFEPSDTSATITRPWTRFTMSIGQGTTHFPVFYGDRIVLMQNSPYSDMYLLSEVTLGTNSFTLSADSVAVSGPLSSDEDFEALRLGNNRLLFVGLNTSDPTLTDLAIIQRQADGSVAAILDDILKRAGYDDGDYDISALNGSSVQGYLLQEPMSARSAIEPLQTYAAFDLVETDGQLKAVRRGGNSAATVAASEWRAHFPSKPEPPRLLSLRAEELDLPREIALEAVDPARDYEYNCQRARRIANSSRTVQKVTLPIVCSAEKAKQIAEARLYTIWAERELVKLYVSRAWLGLDPADVINLGNGRLLRIASIMQSGGLIQIEGFYSYAATLSSHAVADGGSANGVASNAPVSSTLYLMDLPLLQAEDDQPGVYVAATGIAGWKSASVLKSSDSVSYTALTTMTAPAVAGIATTALASGSPYYMDNAHNVNVQLTQGTLSSCTGTDLLNGTNAALLGDEIIQFQTATLIGPGLYTLSNLLRARRGTEEALSTHAIGERFVLLQAATVEFIPETLGNRNKSFSFRALSKGQNLSDAFDYTFTYDMKTLCPLSPANLTGVRSLGISSDLTLTWQRRARLDAEWIDLIDVPLDEAQELYEVDVMNGSAVLRAFKGLTSPTVTYTAAQQTADWGSSIPASFTIKVFQVSARYGNGNAATAII